MFIIEHNGFPGDAHVWTFSSTGLLYQKIQNINVTYLISISLILEAKCVHITLNVASNKQKLKFSCRICNYY